MLMNLAENISVGDMKTIAIEKLEIKKPRVDNLEYGKKPVEFNFEILVLCRNKSPENTKEVGIQTYFTYSFLSKYNKEGKVVR